MKRSPLFQLGPIIVLLSLAASAASQAQLWIRQYGSGNSDVLRALAPDGAGGAFVGGWFNAPNGALADPLLERRDAAGTAIWRATLRTNDFDTVDALLSDGNGGVFVAGTTDGSLGGQRLHGGGEVWLARYDAAGNQAWILQWGLPTRALQARHLAPDGAGGFFLTAGNSFQEYLTRYTGSGTRLWSTSPGYLISGLAADGAGGVFVAKAGISTIARFNGSGGLLWSRQIGSSTEWGGVLAAVGVGGLFMAGTTTRSFGGPHAGGADVWLARLDANGQLMWIRQFGSAGWDAPAGLAVGGAGTASLCGETDGSLAGANAGGVDAWFGVCDAAGNIAWLRQLGTAFRDGANGVAADGSGGIFVGGGTDGALGGTHMGSFDVWLANYSEPWSVAGAGLEGSFGKPALMGSGIPTTGQPISLTLSDALPNAPLVFVVGARVANIPVLGGILVPNPDQTLVGVADGTGTSRVSLTWPSSTPPGTSYWFQTVVLDAGARQRVAASNALRAVQ